MVALRNAVFFLKKMSSQENVKLEADGCVTTSDDKNGRYRPNLIALLKYWFSHSHKKTFFLLFQTTAKYEKEGDDSRAVPLVIFGKSHIMFLFLSIIIILLFFPGDI